ncbi:dihydroorotate dehydrogenase-like protein [uncultured Bacteroides sp.]|uniref:dihydroorotate dehydrogenase-like protein n=1 Tax=uncultured Bacteroides sp. TaxID=162156 RepID=UPI002AA5E415|nr:dihydroorotate dehydrogenase-like protein [uncultured Bacteroides sp.]
MSNLKTTFAGIQLRNPIIISSSGLTNTAEKNQKLCEAGAGAIVLKSLFEEQIMMEVDLLKNTAYYSEGIDYLKMSIENYKVREYLKLIEDSKRLCNIPIIASINCFSTAEWAHFAQEIEQAGADAIEVNILALQTDVEYEYGAFEQRHIDILRNVKEHVSIPVIMKLGYKLTNPVALINQLYANGAAAVVLFNRFYQPDIDVEKMKHTSGEVFSHPSELSRSLRWVGIASATVNKIDYAVSGGVHTPEDVVKAILSGAAAIEVCSAIYQNTNAYIGTMTRFLDAWMIRKGFTNITQFKGRLNVKDVKGVNTFERTQFLKYFNEHKVAE